MALDTNFNANPYYDDFEEDKKFLRLLYKPGYAVQARELTQAQTILQKQIERFGNHVFKNGSIVTGAETFFANTTYLKVDSTYFDADVTANNFAGKIIVDNATEPTKRAEVVKVYEANATTGDPITLLVQVKEGEFESGNTFLTYEDTPVYGNISSSGVGTGQLFSITDGVYYYDGYFIKNSAQTVAVSKYSTSGNARVGLELTESIVDYTSDTSLLDPAQNASNFQAPGSDRYKIDLVLASRALDSEDDEKFIEIARIENGELIKYFKTPIYSVLEDTFARRTYDESGNYTVKPFRIALENNASNTANMDIVLSPGKAYVFGYEYETIAPTRITIERPRDTDNVSNERLTVDYGNFVYANNVYGSFPINDLQTVDLHCVSNASINTSSSDTISKTKIGTTRVKSFSFDTASDLTDATTYEYKAFLFDVNVGSIVGSNTNNNVLYDGTGNNKLYIQIADWTVGADLYSTANNAYVGAKLRITEGPGLGEMPRTISNYNGATQTIRVSEPFVANVNSLSKFSIDFEFNDVRSIVSLNGTSVKGAADIDDRSQDYASEYNDTILTDSTFERTLLQMGNSFVADDTIADMSYSYRRLFEGVTFSSGTTSPTLSLAAGESLASAASTTFRAQNYYIVVTNPGSTTYSIGDVVPASEITDVDTVNKTITVNNGLNMTANIIATIDVSTGAEPKTKTYVAGSSTIQESGGLDLHSNGSVQLFGSEGQFHISANSVIKSYNTPQNLYTSDVFRLNKVYDFNGNDISVANFSLATDITNRYTLNTGQKDSFYDHAYIALKPGQTLPQGPLVVMFDQFVSSGAGFFNVDSYIDGGLTYENIPSFISKTGAEYSLRDVLDFRPVRANATIATSNSVVFGVDATTTGPKIPENGSDILLDYYYYLPRTDRIVLNKNRTISLIKGTSSIYPIDPKEKDNSMHLYTLRHPPYSVSPANTDIIYIENKRYTMRDIGTIEKRIGNLEYYTTLSLLEQSTLNKQDLTILDTSNLPRFKNGIITDSFVGTSVADVFKTDYNIAVDPAKGEIRPRFNIASYSLSFVPGSSSNYTQNGVFITTSSSISPFAEQTKASKVTNVNPFNIINYLGNIELNPKTDIWVDTDRQPEVLVDLTGDKAAWAQIAEATSTYQWNSWESTVVGETSTLIAGTTQNMTRQQALDAGLSTKNAVQGRGRDFMASTDEYSVTSTIDQVRSGVKSTVTFNEITQSIGDKVVDVSIVHYMRNASILFVGTDFKPNRELYSFFDNTTVDKYVARANKFIIANTNLQYKTEIGNPEVVTIRNTTTATNNGTAISVKTSNNEVFVVNIEPSTYLNLPTGNLIGQTSGVSQKIIGYEHYSGIVNAATVSSVTLRIDATGANNEVYYANTSNSNTIYIVSGTGAGQSRTMNAYNSSTRTANVSSNWTTIPDTTSVYSIGQLRTNKGGDTVGIFNVPASTFRVGEKPFRLIDNSTNDVGSSTTNGDASFYAQGLIQKVNETIISATVPGSIRRQSVQEERTITSTTTERRVSTWYDPLAQTFLIAPGTYPNGLFINRIRFCFKTKDDTVPVTLQIRPTVNGYPSYSVIYPYATVSLTPDKVKITDAPNLDDAAKYTEFVFDTPIYMQPGEHSFVLLSNSNKYEVYTAEIGKLDLVTSRKISDNPYNGVLFLSQNGSTWTADQSSDLMFRIYRAQFSTSPTTVQFDINAPSSQKPFDVMHVTVGDLVLPDTTINYRFNSTMESTSADSGYLPFIPNQNYDMNDGYGRRILTTANDSFSVQATMLTDDPTISPVIDTTRFGVLTIENIINQLPLLNSGFEIVNGGSGYANTEDVTVTITNGTTSSNIATASANVTGSGVIDAIYLTNHGGQDYIESPTITITAGSGGGSGAVVTYNGEDKKLGGNSFARYMNRVITLRDGFESGDLRVYLTAYRPTGSKIYVYYKIQSESDPDNFDTKNYQLMTEIGNSNFVSINQYDYRELTFAPGINGEANNSISYSSGDTSYNTFKKFAIKIVLSGNNPIDVPKVRDFRAIALPAGA